MDHIQPPLSILQISDLHLFSNREDCLLGINTDYYFHEVINQAFADNQYDLVLISGDLAQDPCPSSYKRIKQALEKYQIPCICIPGNHDDLPLMQQLYNTEQISCKKQSVFKYWQLIGLNSQIINQENGRLEKDELRFLDRCLSESPDLNALIAVHHQCIPTKSAWLDAMMIENRDELFDILKRHPQTKAITTGHIHQTVDTEYESIRIFGTPSTCFQFKPLSERFAVDHCAPGYRHIKLHPDGSIETEVKRLTVLLDELNMQSEGY